MALRRTPLERGAKPLHRHTALRRVSAKRTAGTGFTRRPARYTGPDVATVQALWRRDDGRCGWCGHPIDPYTVRGLDWSVQHRRPRRRDGVRPDTNLPSNLELLHGSGTTGCHGQVENRDRAHAIRTGHLLHADDVPSRRPIEHAVHGWCYLTDDGTTSTAPPPIDLGDRVDFGGYLDDEVPA
jgi:hypothetical protein